MTRKIDGLVIFIWVYLVIVLPSLFILYFIKISSPELNAFSNLLKTTPDFPAILISTIALSTIGVCLSLFRRKMSLIDILELLKQEKVYFEEYLKISAIISFLLGKYSIGYSHGIRSKLYSVKVRYNDVQHVSQTFADLLNPLCISAKIQELTKLKYGKEDMDHINKLLNKIKMKNGKIAAISAGAAESAKCRMWPKEKWAELIDRIPYENVLLIGGKDVYRENEEILGMLKSRKHVCNIAGMTSQNELFALMEKVSLVISIDSGPMHVAAAQRIKTVGLFCPNTPVRFGPLGKGNISIYKPVLPKPCINVHKGEVPNCGRHNHMSKIAVEDVFQAARKSI